MNTVWNIPHVRWPGFRARYARTLGAIGLFGLASVSSTALAAVVLRYRLWPRSVMQPLLTQADRLVFRRLAQMPVRRPRGGGDQRFLHRSGPRG
jgi:hypothetical protein